MWSPYHNHLTPEQLSQGVAAIPEAAKLQELKIAIRAIRKQANELTKGYHQALGLKTLVAGVTRARLHQQLQILVPAARKLAAVAQQMEKPRGGVTQWLRLMRLSAYQTELLCALEKHARYSRSTLADIQQTRFPFFELQETTLGISSGSMRFLTPSMYFELHSKDRVYRATTREACLNRLLASLNPAQVDDLQTLLKLGDGSVMISLRDLPPQVLSAMK